MRRAWCTVPLLASVLFLVVSAFTDVQATPPEQHVAQSTPEGVSPRAQGITTHQEIMAQSLPGVCLRRNTL